MDNNIKVGDKLSELTSSAIDSIKYKSTDIKTDVTGLNVSVTNVTKDNNKTEFSKINTSAGTYKITYSVTFTYKSKSISKDISFDSKTAGENFCSVFLYSLKASFNFSLFT